MPADKIDEAIRVYREQVLPALQQERGFQSVTLTADRKSGKTLAISVWESEEALRAGEAAYQQALTTLRPFLGGQTTREHYEVFVQA